MPEYKYAIHDGYDPYGFSTEGLVLYVPLWALKGSPFPSIDAYGHICTATGALWRPNSREFDGLDDNITCGTGSDVLSTTGDFTIEIWFRRLREHTDWESIMGKARADGARSNYDLSLINGTNKLRFELSWDNGDWTDSNFDSDDALPTDIWIHVVGTVISKHMRLYLDTVVQTINPTFAGTIDTNTEKLYVGMRRPAGEPAKIDVGEVRFYNRALPLAEIRHNRNATKWRFG